MSNFICNGTRNSKWYYNDVSYIRKMQTRSGIKTRVYSKEDIRALPDNPNEPSVVTLKDHLNNILAIV